MSHTSHKVRNIISFSLAQNLALYLKLAGSKTGLGYSDRPSILLSMVLAHWFLGLSQMQELMRQDYWKACSHCNWSIQLADLSRNSNFPLTSSLELVDNQFWRYRNRQHHPLSIRLSFWKQSWFAFSCFLFKSTFSSSCQLTFSYFGGAMCFHFFFFSLASGEIWLPLCRGRPSLQLSEYFALVLVYLLHLSCYCHCYNTRIRKASVL